jgi:hypothetical protein
LTGTISGGGQQTTVMITMTSDDFAPLTFRGDVVTANLVMGLFDDSRVGAQLVTFRRTD